MPCICRAIRMPSRSCSASMYLTAMRCYAIISPYAEPLQDFITKHRDALQGFASKPSLDISPPATYPLSEQVPLWGHPSQCISLTRPCERMEEARPDNEKRMIAICRLRNCLQLSLAKYTERACRGSLSNTSACPTFRLCRSDFLQRSDSS